jgi:hypothetical protein
LKKGNNSLAASIPTLPGGPLKGGGKKSPQVYILRYYRNSEISTPFLLFNISIYHPHISDKPVSLKPFTL